MAVHQDDLFSVPPPRQLVDTPPPYSRPGTSFDAAEAIRPHVAGQRATILDYLKDFGPASAETLAAVLGMPGDSVRPRLVELRKLHLVKEHGEGITRNGRRCVTWGIA